MTTAAIHKLVEEREAQEKAHQRRKKLIAKS
jgi:hypothetical protein